jgi:hypothetical protein
MRRHLTYANVTATLALFIALCGAGAYAAGQIGSSDIERNAVKARHIKDGKVGTAEITDASLLSKDFASGQLPAGATGPQGPKGDTGATGQQGVAGPSTGPAGGDLTGTYPDPLIGPNAVAGGEVADNAMTGADVDESTLQNVNAGTVGGLQVRKINFQVPVGTGPTTVLDLAGLQITAECQNFGDNLDVKAHTAKNGATAFYFSGSPFGADDTDAMRDIHSAASGDGSFDIGEQLEIDNATTSNGNGMGTLNYSAPDGSVVVAHLALDELRNISGAVVIGCGLTGIAIGG